MSKIEDIKPQHYWKIAKEYIIAKDKELREEGIYYIDKNLALSCVKFGSILKHTSGDLAGKNFRFMDWQIHAIVDILGTKYLDGRFKGLRRYQRALFYTPKKAGKTEFGALLNAIVFFIDKEKGKEQYSIASEIEQAKILHKAFLTMLKQEDELLNMVKVTVKPPRITKEDGSFTDEYEALSSTADSKDGKKPSMVLCDETHTYTNKDLYQIMVDGMASRLEPLEIHMSTAGYNMQGFFYRDIYLYAKKLKEGVLQDERFYYVMFEPDEEDLKDDDYWKKPSVWAKANPNLGVSPTYSYMEGKIKMAEQSEQSLIAFKTKHLNVWCDKYDIWIKHAIWTQNQRPIDEKELRGRICYGGLDLASTTDLACWGLLFPKDNGEYDFLPRFFIPKENMKERVRRDKVPYFDWLKDDLIIATEGNTIDYEFIEDRIKKDCEKFDVKLIAYDRYNASDIIRRLTDEEITTLVPFGQGFVSMSPPTKQIEVLALKGALNHGDNPVMNWNCSNVVLKRDPADNIKMDKAESIEKIDGMISLAMALGVAMVDYKEEVKISPYENRGLREL